MEEEERGRRLFIEGAREAIEDILEGDLHFCYGRAIARDQMAFGWGVIGPDGAVKEAVLEEVKRLSRGMKRTLDW